MSNPINDPVIVHFRVTVTVDRQEWAEDHDIDPAEVPEDIVSYVANNVVWTVRGVTDLGGTVTTAHTP